MCSLHMIEPRKKIDKIIIIDKKEHRVKMWDTGCGYHIEDPNTRIFSEGYTLEEAEENFREMVRSPWHRI